ncbi:MAG TPA: metalloregulator ArsR/SmtB family transcription factor [Streptosporangiaceae bacterium]|jgi:DNA-binding transcriptional ArsR family regulator
MLMTATADERLDLVFGALADRTRRQLLAQLTRAPASITELAAPHDMSLPGISKHVRVLEHAGLIRRTIDGRVHRCALDAAAMRAADDWLARYRVFWTHTLDALADYVSEDPE